MPRVQEITDAGDDPVLQRAFEQDRAQLGDLYNTTKVMAHCPPIMEAAKALYASFGKSGRVPAALQALVHTRVATINGCPFWVDINSVRAIGGDKNGEAKVAALGDWRNSDVYSDLERVVLEYGERMTITGQTVDDQLFDRLRQHFDDAQIVELTASIAMENFRSKFNVPLQVESQGFCVLPATGDKQT